MRTLKLSGQIVAFAAVAGLLGLLVWKLTHQTKAPKIGARAPAFSLKLVDAPGTLALASLRGKPVVLNFWASWCVPCKGEAAMLESASRQYRKQGVVFLGVDYHDVTVTRARSSRITASRIRPCRTDRGRSRTATE